MLEKTGKGYLTVGPRGSRERPLVSAWADEHLFTVKFCLGKENP